MSAQQAAGNAVGGASAWVAGHKPVLAGGAAVLGVGLFALHQRNKSAAANGAGTVTPAAQAGLTAAPNTTPTDVETWVQDALNAQNAELNRALHQPKPPKAPHTPPPLPRPGHSRYTIRRGDTLERIAQAVYGNADKASVRAIKLANPLLWTFTATARLDHYAGDTLRIPPLHHRGGHQQPPKKPRRPRREHGPREPRKPRRRPTRQPHPHPHEPHPPHQPAPHPPQRWPRPRFPQQHLPPHMPPRWPQPRFPHEPPPAPVPRGRR